MFRAIVPILVVCVAMLARPALAAGWPPELAAANHSLETAKSYRITRSEGPALTVTEVQRPDREKISMSGQVVVRIGDGVWMRNPGEAWKTLGAVAVDRVAAFGVATIPTNAMVVREADQSDGVSAAHLYHVIYPGGTPQLRWYVRVSDGLVHKILSPGKSHPQIVTIDQYNHVPAINAPPHK
jgi:hypothetical protein